MKIKILISFLVFIIFFHNSSCVVKGPVGPYYHRHSPRHFFPFQYWASPFGYPYSRGGHSAMLYRPHRSGTRRDRRHYFTKNFVPHPSYHRADYH